MVLYVEDNPQNRRLVRRILEGTGWRYEEAENGQLALDRLEADPLPDVILMDLAMPVLDGYETTRRLKSDERTGRLPVVALTAHAMVGDRERAEAAGCDEYLTKPVDPELLVETLGRFLPQEASDPASPRPRRAPQGEGPGTDQLLSAMDQALEEIEASEGRARPDLAPARQAAEVLLARLIG